MNAAQLDENGNRPPEVRLGRIEANGRVKLEFTNAMIFPSEREFILLNEKSGNELIELIMLKGDEDVQDDNLKSWKIISVSPTLIEIDLEFENPVQVSQGDNNDRLITQVALSRYPDENQNRLPASINRIKDIPR